MPKPPKDSVRLVLSPARPASPVGHAVAALEEALRQKGVSVTRAARPAGDAGSQWTVGLERLRGTGILPVPRKDFQASPSDAPESLLIRRPDSATLLIAGSDARGLAYALLEAAEAVRLAPPGGDPLAAVHEAAESPYLRLRSVSMGLYNADLERAWYFDEAFWHAYFARLVRCRFNTFILRFADQTNYLAPPYPWLFELPDYPGVRVEGLSPEEQARNLAMLRRISELAAEHGLDFAVAIWQQQPVLNPSLPAGPYAHNYGASALRGLPAGAALSDYSTKALARLLQECPTIRHLQLRMNDESGVPDAAQQEYFRGLFEVLRRQPAPVRLELRYKGLKPETVDQAVAAGLEVIVSTKFWCEHLGLPFHPTAQDPRYSASRYGYGTLLRRPLPLEPAVPGGSSPRPRGYRIAYQLWSQGSSRVLLWGDPDYAARFAESCALGEADGFEVFAPLTNRGWGNEPGTWRLLARPALESFQWEAERYWPFYLAFGRMGYNPETAAEVWPREFSARFGAAGADVERACRTASRILPLVTASGMTSASEWSYWPELDLGGPLAAYSVMPPGDPAQFYAIRAWQPVAGWSGDVWSTDRRGFVEDALADAVEAKWTPFQVAAELDRLADEVLELSPVAAEIGGHGGPPPRVSELPTFLTDLRALAFLARYHAAKKRAATHLAFFEATGEAGRLARVLEHAQAAASAWESLVAVTDGVYSDNLVFGRSRQMVGTPDRPVNAHAGHWRDRLPQVRADVAFARALLAQHGGAGPEFRVYPGEVPLAEPPVVRHAPVTQARAGTDLALEAQVTSAVPLSQVLLWYRPMDQTQAWTALAMQQAAPGVFRGAIPGRVVTESFDVLYYLEARVAGGGTLWPDWREACPYIKVSVNP